MDRYIKNPNSQTITEKWSGTNHSLAGLYAAPAIGYVPEHGGYLAGVRRQDVQGTATVEYGERLYIDRDAAMAAAETAAIAAIRPFEVTPHRIKSLRPGDQVLMGSLHGTRVANATGLANVYEVVGGATAEMGPVVRYRGGSFATVDPMEIDAEGFLVSDDLRNIGIIAFSPFHGVTATDPNWMLKRLLEAVVQPEMLKEGDQVLIRTEQDEFGVAEVQRVAGQGYGLKLMASQAEGHSLPSIMVADLHGQIEGVGRIVCASTTRFAPEEGRDALMHLAYDSDNRTWIGAGNGIPLNELVPESLYKPARFAFNVNPQVLTALSRHDTVIYRGLPHQVNHLDGSTIGLYCPLTQQAVQVHRDGKSLDGAGHQIEAVLQATYGNLTHYAVSHAYKEALAKGQLIDEAMLDTELSALRDAQRGDSIALYTPAGRMISAQVSRPAGGLSKNTVLVVTTDPGEPQRSLNVSLTTGACLESDSTFAGRFNFIPRGRTPREVFSTVAASVSDVNETVHYLSHMNSFLRDCGFDAHGRAVSDLAGMDGRVELYVDLDQMTLKVRSSFQDLKQEYLMDLYSDEARSRLDQLQAEFPAFSQGMAGHRYNVAEAPSTRVRAMSM